MQQQTATMKVRLSYMSVSQKIQVLRHQMKEVCLEREYHIDALIALMISKQHGLLLGPPGTGKSMLIELLCKAFSGNYFTMLISESVKPEQFFGPISIKAMKGDKEDYLRNIDKMLPTADIAYLDEIFKVNSGSLNDLLKLINERTYKHGREVINVPLRSMIGSSNELPEEGTGAAAFLDRFAWKNWVDYLEHDDNITTLWERELDSRHPQVTVKLALSDLDTAEQSALNTVEIKSQIPLLRTLKRKLKDAGYTISDRKWSMILKFMRVFAWVRSEESVSLDVIKLLLPDCMWQQPEDQKPIADKVAAIIKDITARLNEIKSCLELAITNKDSDFNQRDIYAVDNWNAQALNSLHFCSEWAKEVESLRQVGVPEKDCANLAQNIIDAVSYVRQKIDSVNNTHEQVIKDIEWIVEKDKQLTSQIITDSINIVDLNVWNDSASNAVETIGNTIEDLKNLSGKNEISKTVTNAKNRLKSMLTEIHKTIIQVNDLSTSTLNGQTA